MRQLAERVPSVSFRHPGELIKYTRKKMGISQRYTARKADMSPSGLCKIESGEHFHPRNVIKLAKVLHLNPIDLLSFELPNKNQEKTKSLDDLKKEFPNWKDLFREGIKELL